MGNTPTCVGKTLRDAQSYRRCRKHPHVRGEDDARLVFLRHFGETPPRAWGRQRVRASFTVYRRNTPTCVGKTKSVIASAHIAEKHPHVRGEDCIRRRGSTLELETPPRAWGRPQRGQVEHLPGRNTPTCVGKTGVRHNLSPLCRKHPHVRGEDISFLCTAGSSTETPPRAWGRRSHAQVQSRGVGNTPTCVGKTNAEGFQITGEKKHPHVRGEDQDHRKSCP